MAPPSSFRLEDFTTEKLKENVFLNKVGTFGVTSAGYWWGCTGGATVRLGHYVTGIEDALRALLYSDDGKVIGRTERYERGVLLYFFVMMVVGTPISWRKVRGGEASEWIGYWVDVGRFEMGVTKGEGGLGGFEAGR